MSSTLDRARFPTRTRAAVAGLRMIITAAYLQQRRKFWPDTTATDFLWALRGYLNATDERDHFYGLLGLVRQNPERSKFMKWLRVDYTLSSNVVAGDAVRFCITQSGQLRNLEEADGLYFLPDSAEMLDRPSWVPPLASSSPFATFSGKYFCARRPIDLELIQQSVSDKALLLKGFRLFRVSKVTTHHMFTRDVSLCEQLYALGRTMRDSAHLCEESQGSMKSMLRNLFQRTRDLDVDRMNETDCLAWMETFAQHCFQKANQLKPVDTPPNELPGLDLTEYDEDHIRFICARRRFFITECGKIGLGRASVGVGDWIAALFGGRHLCVLRDYCPQPRLGFTIDRKHDQHCFQFVGLASIDGAMNGEAVDEKEAAGQEPETFEIW